MHWMQDSTNWPCQEASEQGRAGQGRFPGNGCCEGPMLLVQSFSEPLLTEGVIQLHKNLWEAGGSKTGPWLNEGNSLNFLN